MGLVGGYGARRRDYIYSLSHLNRSASHQAPATEILFEGPGTA